MNSSFDPFAWSARNVAKQQAASDANIDLQTAEDTQAAGQAAASRWNGAALAGARRRAGGSTYRHRGTTLSTAPSMLDKANIDQMAAARRKKANADMVAAQKPMQISSTLGDLTRLW